MVVRGDLNPRHADFQSAALPTELPDHTGLPFAENPFEQTQDSILWQMAKRVNSFFKVSKLLRHPQESPGQTGASGEPIPFPPSRKRGTICVTRTTRHAANRHHSPRSQPRNSPTTASNLMSPPPMEGRWAKRSNAIETASEPPPEHKRPHKPVAKRQAEGGTLIVATDAAEAAFPICAPEPKPAAQQAAAIAASRTRTANQSTAIAATSLLGNPPLAHVDCARPG